MNQFIVRDLDVNNFDIHDLNSIIIFMYDSFGNISKSDNIHKINKKININKLESKIREKINLYKFKTLQNRFYLPIGSSIYLKFDDINVLYVPIMWINQDISNTNNIYHSLKNCLKHIIKINKLNEMNINKIYVNPNENFKKIQQIQIDKALDDFKNINLDTIIETLDFKKNCEINIGYYDINEQSPIYQNNEFRELSNF
jgi:hypothetical protein